MIVIARGCSQTFSAQIGSRFRLRRWRQLLPASSCGHRFPRFCKTSFLLAGSGERAAISLTRVTSYRRSQRKTTTPNYSLKHARSGSDRWTACAVMAVAHTILVNGYHLQKNGCDYKDLGRDYFDRLDAAGLKRYLVRRLEGLGHRVILRNERWWQ